MTAPLAITAADLEPLISTQRFATFRQAEPQPDVAVALYMWNAQVAGAFAELLHHVEVLVRNAMHHQLTTLHARAPGRPANKAWFDEPKWAKHHWFPKVALDQIGQAAERAGHTPAHPNPGKVIAALNFGFWRYLASARYEQSFWVPALDNAFCAPGATPQDRRREIEHRLIVLHKLRNRISHCEPIIHPIRYTPRGGTRTSKTLNQLYVDAVELVSYVSPIAAPWLEGQTRALRQLLRDRPTSSRTKPHP